LKVSEGRVSQVLNNPGNLTLRKIVEYVRALGRKVAIVEYDDGDHENLKGPVNSEIFATCWYTAGAPDDFFALESAAANKMTYMIAPTPQPFIIQAKFRDNASNKGNASSRIRQFADNAKTIRRVEDVEMGAR
jgi:hypothetical protein